MSETLRKVRKGRFSQRQSFWAEVNLMVDKARTDPLWWVLFVATEDDFEEALRLAVEKHPDIWGKEIKDANRD